MTRADGKAVRTGVPVNRLLPALLASAVLTTGCSAFSVINAASPNRYYEAEKAIAYGEHDRQRLDVYVPSEPAASPAPVVVFFYGGGWRRGERANYEFVASALTRDGYVVVIPDYRVWPQVTFPAFVEDAARAVDWACANAASRGGDCEQLFLMGHSAGAHIAALLALDPSYLAAASARPIRPMGLIGLSGPYDFLPLDEGYLREVFPAITRAASQPVAHVTANAPRTLLIHGTDDEIVDADNARSLAAALEEVGVDVTLKLYDGQGHRRVAAGLAPPLDFLNDSLEDSMAFINAR